MSILQTTTETEEQQLTKAVSKIKSAPQQLALTMFVKWNQAFDELWNDQPITVNQKLLALGTDAKELFELNSAFTSFMISQLTGKRDDLVALMQAKLNTIPSYTINEDGTVTLN